MKAHKILTWADIDMAQLDLQKMVTHYIQSCRAEGLSPRTVKWYNEMLQHFIKYLRAADVDIILAEFTAQNVRSFIISEQLRGLSPSTVQGRVRTLKTLASWLYREEYTPVNVLANVRRPKIPAKVVEPLTVEEIDKLISIQNPLSAIGCRNVAILIMLLDTGLRVSELATLRYEDAHIEEGYVKVMGKGAKERLVPVGSSLRKVLWRYVFHFRPEPLCNDYNTLFLTANGEPVSSNAIQLLLHGWGKRAGVPRLHPHLCRHTFATNYLANGCGDVFHLQMILGHTTLEMVRRYVHLASARSLMYNGAPSPMDKMGIKQIKGYKIDKQLRKINRRAANS